MRLGWMYQNIEEGKRQNLEPKNLRKKSEYRKYKFEYMHYAHRKKYVLRKVEKEHLNGWLSSVSSMIPIQGGESLNL